MIEHYDGKARSMVSSPYPESRSEIKGNPRFFIAFGSSLRHRSGRLSNIEAPE